MRKALLWIVTVVVILWIGTSIISSFYYTNHSFEAKGGWFMGPMNCWIGGMWIFPVIVLVVILIFIYSIFERGTDWTPLRDSGKNRLAGRNSETALEILKKRYAKGEITKEEFEQIKRDISD